MIIPGRRDRLNRVRGKTSRCFSNSRKKSGDKRRDPARSLYEEMSKGGICESLMKITEEEHAQMPTTRRR